MKIIDKKIQSLLFKAEQTGIFPAAAVGIEIFNGNTPKKILINSGNRQILPRTYQLKPNTYFDLASLTKPLSTVLSLITLVNTKKISLEQKVQALFSIKFPDDKREITVSQLLNHCSGLPSYLPYYRSLASLPLAARADALLRLILSEPLVAPPGTRAIYSDLGFILLGFVIEKISGLALDRYFRLRVAAPLGLAAGIFYNRLPARRRGSYAATEDCPWRERLICGEVSDENCWVLGGVAGHAGLFGRVETVLALVHSILGLWLGKIPRSAPDLGGMRHFLEARSPVSGSTWALGFDRPSPGVSSSGRYLSPNSVGHLGFTGTSFWIDPERQLSIVLLTNRVHPSRENNLLKEFRPYFHDRVIELLGLV